MKKIYGGIERTESGGARDRRLVVKGNGFTEEHDRRETKRETVIRQSPRVSETALMDRPTDRVTVMRLYLARTFRLPLQPTILKHG